MQPIRQFGIDFRYFLFFVLTACSTKPIVVSEHEASPPASPVEIKAKPEVDEPKTPTCKPSELGPRYFLEFQLAQLDPRQAALKRSTSIRLPGDAKPADHWLGGGLPERCKKLGSMAQCPPMLTDLLDYQPVAITTCGEKRPNAKLLHVYHANVSLPADFDQLGRNVDYYLERCGIGQAIPRSYRTEDRIKHQLFKDKHYCEIELAASDVDASHIGDGNHYFALMRFRINSTNNFEGKVVAFAVREDEWTDEVADIIRASARTFEVDWKAVDARRKLDQLIDR